MERSERPLPLNISNLGRLALKCFAYAKALHVKVCLRLLVLFAELPRSKSSGRTPKP